MVAEKKFDRQYLSARRALDALELFRDKAAVAMKDATDRDELIAVVAREPGDSGLFDHWKTLFTLPTGEAASNEVVDAVEADDSIIGWTAANVFKRLAIGADQVDRIVHMSYSGRAIIRWRACHVMGSAFKEKFREALLDRVTNDPDENVRYGAIRSLIELSSQSSELAGRLVEDLEPLLDKIAASPRVMNELTRAVFLSPGRMPDNWSMEISRLFYACADKATDTVEMEAWSKLSSDLRRHDRLPA